MLNDGQQHASLIEKPFSFHGNAKEYFGIWIVNVLLTILTLGIYSAWAKVRRQRYFYGNADLDGHRFEYLATPKQILIGRIVVFAFLIIYNVLVNLFPIAGLVLFAVLLIAIPELFRRGMRFNARVSSYRNVRFDFTGTYGGAFIALIVGPIVSFLSLGFLAPFSARWTQNYILSHLTYGGRKFNHTATTKNYYGVWWLPAALFFLGFAAVGTFAAAILQMGGYVDFAADDPDWIALLPFIPLYIFSLVLFGAVGLIYAAGVRNVAFNATTLDGKHQLGSTVNRWSYVVLMVTNFFASILSLGLLRPWAAVRHARFLANNTALHVESELGKYIDTIEPQKSAIGSEFLDIEGIDVSI